MASLSHAVHVSNETCRSLAESGMTRKVQEYDLLLEASSFS